MLRVLVLLPLGVAILARPAASTLPDGVRPDPDISAWYRSLRDIRGLS